MPKSRRKDAIRARAQAQLAALPLRPHLPVPADWRGVFLDALLNGLPVTSAARKAGVSRWRAYDERVNEAFDLAWDEARRCGRRGVRFVTRRLWPPPVRLPIDARTNDLWTRLDDKT